MNQPAIKFFSEAQLNEFLDRTPEYVARVLNLTGRSRELFEASSNYRSLREASMDALLNTSFGVSRDDPNAINNSSARFYLNGDRRRTLEQIEILKTRVSPVVVAHDTGIAFFDATFTCIPAGILGDWAKDSSFVFTMSLSEEDMEELRSHWSKGRAHMCPDAFAVIKLSCLEGGEVRLNTIKSRGYERLNCPELRFKYRDWQKQLLLGLEYYLRVAGNIKISSLEDRSLFQEFQPSFISLPSLAIGEVIRKVFAELDSTANDDPEYVAETKELMLNQLDLYREIRRASFAARQLGYLLERTNRSAKDSDVIDLDDAKYDQTLSFAEKIFGTGYVYKMKIAPLCRESFLQSDHKLASQFEILEVTPGSAALAKLDECFPPSLYDTLTKGPTTFTHAIKPKFWSNRVLTTVRRHFDLAPAEAMSPNDLLRNIGYRERDLFLMEFRNPYARFARRLIGDDFVPISKAVTTGGQRDWWRIPKVASSVNFSSTHLPDQNRHPYIRVALSSSEADKLGVSERFTIGFKGAGFCEQGIAEFLIPTDGYAVPIQSNFAQDKPVEGEKDKSNPAPFSKLWGGDSFYGQVLEAAFTLALRSHVTTHVPDLLSLIPQPLTVLRLKAMPIWKDGETNWLAIEEYERRFLQDSRSKGDTLSVLASIEPCDVRIRQLYQRVFVRSEEGLRDYRVAGNEVGTALKSLFWWNAESCEVSIDQAIARAKSLSISDLLGHLADEYERNPERAERVLDRTVGRLTELVGFVHGCGGDFGSGLRKDSSGNWFGTAWGGPMAMRNIDLTGGLHDFDLVTLHFPWSAMARDDGEKLIMKREEHPRSRAWDLAYLGEAINWLDVILRGRRDAKLDKPSIVPFVFDRFNDITALNDRSDSSFLECIKAWRQSSMKDGMSADHEIPLALLGDRGRIGYLRGLKRGRAVTKQT